MFIRNLGTRERSVFTAVLTSIILIVLISPIFNNYLKWIVLPPSQVNNIQVIEKDKEIDISWSKLIDQAVKGYNIYLNNVLINQKLIESNVDNYSIYNLNNGNQYSFRIEVKDIYGKVTQSQSYPVEATSTTKNLTFNPVEKGIKIQNITLIVLGIGILLFLMNLWVLFFKLNLKTSIIIGAFPSVTIISYLLLAISYYDTLNNLVIKIAISSLITLIYGVITYLLILSSNILNGSLQTRIPLAQAAKATQFIFGLISTYLILIYLFSIDLDLYLRILFLVLFVSYFTYSSISMLQTLKESQVVYRVSLIVLLMAFSVVILSLWPLNTLYIVLAISVLYYILLNVALEIRAKLGKGLWIEYTVLLLLILFLFLTSASWGIKGTII